VALHRPGVSPRPDQPIGGTRSTYVCADPPLSTTEVCPHFAHIDERGPPSPKGERASDLLSY